jgi:hypothetical protein
MYLQTFIPKIDPFFNLKGYIIFWIQVADDKKKRTNNNGLEKVCRKL